METKSKSYKSLRPVGFNTNSILSHAKIAKNIRNQSGYLKIEVCPHCGCRDSNLYILQFDIKIMKCSNCDLIYSSEQPINLSEVYSNSDYFEVTKKAYVDSEQERILLFAEDRFNFIIKYKPNFKNILDFGAGTGWFLNFVRSRGIDVNAFEFSEQLINFLRVERSIKTYGKIDGIKEKFDVITLFDVIEHHPSPNLLLSSLKKLLNPNGIIVVYTPNIDSIAFKFLGINNNLLCPPQHLFYFNIKTLSNIALSCGLKVVDHIFAGLDAYDINSFLLDKFGSSCFDSDNILINLQSIIDASCYANHMRVVLSHE